MTILRAGCYERVSTDEQKKFGYSISAQTSALNSYCEENKIKIVDHYTDEGISGAKPPLKRPALQRLLDDVQAGKIDIIIFTKLDRWFRSVKEYYKVQEILDNCGVQWKAIHETYDTTTANGQFAITVFLAIAQQERDRDSERIRAVLDHKRRNKEACFGGDVPPFGYKKEPDENGVLRMVKDPETRQACEEFFHVLLTYGSLNEAIRRMKLNYGIAKPQKSWSRIAKSEFYCGMWGDVDDYCEPYVTKKEWLAIHDNLKKKTYKTKNNRVYLFTGLLRCPECGKRLHGNYRKTKSGENFYYRCQDRVTTCGYKRAVSQNLIERYLLDNLPRLIGEEIVQAEIERTKPKPKPKLDANKFKEQLRRLEVVYMAGNKPDGEYLKEQAEIKAMIAKAENEAPPPEKDLDGLRDLLSVDFESAYNLLEPIDKQRFWRQTIDEIKLDDNKVKKVDFK